MFSGIPQVKEAQAKAPGLLCPRQPDEEIGDLLVLSRPSLGVETAVLFFSESLLQRKPTVKAVLR